MPDWDAIKAEYLAGGIGLKRLAQKHGVPYGTMRRRADIEHWTKLRDGVEIKASSLVLDDISEAKRANCEKLYDAADQILDCVIECIRALRGTGEAIQPKTLKELSGVLKDIKDVKNARSPLDVDEQKARIAALRKSVDDADKSQTVKIVIDEEARSWAK